MNKKYVQISEFLRLLIKTITASFSAVIGLVIEEQKYMDKSVNFLNLLRKIMKDSNNDI
jgi:hypothetical protein